MNGIQKNHRLRWGKDGDWTTEAWARLRNVLSKPTRTLLKITTELLPIENKPASLAVEDKASDAKADEKPEENDPQKQISDLKETLSNLYDDMAATEKFAKKTEAENDGLRKENTKLKEELAKVKAELAQWEWLDRDCSSNSDS